MNIRRMTIDDIDILCRLEEECFSDPWHRESFEDMLENTNAIFLVVEEKKSVIDMVENGDIQSGASEDNLVMGYAGMLSVVGEGEICNVAVTEAARGRGLGKAVVQALIDIGRTDYDIKAYTLEVRINNNNARKLYESLGFECEGIRPGYYDNPKEDAAIYWLK